MYLHIWHCKLLFLYISNTISKLFNCFEFSISSILIINNNNLTDIPATTQPSPRALEQISSLPSYFLLTTTFFFSLLWLGGILQPDRRSFQWLVLYLFSVLCCSYYLYHLYYYYFSKIMSLGSKFSKMVFLKWSNQKVIMHPNLLVNKVVGCKNPFLRIMKILILLTLHFYTINLFFSILSINIFKEFHW